MVPALSLNPLLSSLSPASAVTIVEPPPVPGGYLEPSYHMHTNAEPRVLLQTCWAALQTVNVDCAPKLDRFKIKCAAYKNGAKIPFTVRVFTSGETSADRRYALEFQRRSVSEFEPFS